MMDLNSPYPHQFITDWIQSAKDGKINKTYLLIFINFYYRHMSNEDSTYSLILQVLDSQIKNKYVATYADEITELNQPMKNMNNVILSATPINPKIITIIDSPILYCHHIELIDTVNALNGKFSYAYNMQLKEQKKFLTKEMIPEVEHFFKIQKTNPIEIIKCRNFWHIRRCLFHLVCYGGLMKDILFGYLPIEFKYSSLHSLLLLDLSVIMADPTMYLTETYRVDRLLFERNILTARLAKLIYKLSTLNFNHSDTKIGIFYRNEFKTSSKTFHIPKKLLIAPTRRKIKVYDLNNFFNSQ